MNTALIKRNHRMEAELIAMKLDGSAISSEPEDWGVFVDQAVPEGKECRKNLRFRVVVR